MAVVAALVSAHGSADCLVAAECELTVVDWDL